jgi:ABC-type sulfate/molybdate transport systems ATPase subunit
MIQTGFDRCQRIEPRYKKRFRSGFVFQDLALGPHLTVFGNVGFSAPDDAEALADRTVAIRSAKIGSVPHAH